MGKIKLPACSHEGLALWVDWWQWWCGGCGLTVPEYHLIGILDAHKAGDVVFFYGQEGQDLAEA